LIFDIDIDFDFDFDARPEMPQSGPAFNAVVVEIGKK
jgi:hypothetical protein